MKRFFAVLMAVMFLGTTAVVLAQDATPVASPAAAPVKAKKHHHKKAAPAAAAPAATPAK